MKTVSVRDTRNSSSMVEAWLAEGGEIRMERRGRPMGFLTAWRGKARKARGTPNFAARRKATWGSRVFTEDEVAAMRAAESAGEEG